MNYWDDMHDKFGFNDGESVPEQAWLCRAAYIRWINRRAADLDSAWRVVAFDRSGCHNWCLIETVPYASVKRLSEKKLWDGSVDQGLIHFDFDSDGALEQAISEAQSAELDDYVQVKVKLLPMKGCPQP